jgi:outer membrane receptor for ferrienterochelin and colicins
MHKPLPHLNASAWLATFLMAASPALQAQTPVAPAAAASAPAPAKPQQVQITGTTAPDSSDERRRATASRITYGREELDRMGDASLGEVLKRLPGVTLGGPPGRGGQVRMRGMGGGYTQILIDGQRMAPGFSLDSIAPEQIEKIEIMRAPVAEFGTRAIAGTINVVMRSDFKRKANEFKIGGGADGSQPQVGASWATNGQADNLGYNLSATAFRSGQDSDSDSRTLAQDADGTTTLDQRVHRSGDSQRRGLFVNGRLQWRLGPGQGLDLQPFLNMVRTRGNGLAVLDQPVGAVVPYTRATSRWRA